MEIFEDAEVTIDVIYGVCPGVADKMRAILDKAIKISCTADADSKVDLFKEMRDCLDWAEKECPKMAKEIDYLRDLVDEGETIKCGGS